MEHLFKNDKILPMFLQVDKSLRQADFVTNDIVMPEDIISGNGIRGTIKDIIEERPSRGRWLEDEEKPTWYKVQLY